MKATPLLMKFSGFFMTLLLLAIQVVGQQPAHNREPASPKREASTKVQAVVRAQSATANTAQPQESQETVAPKAKDPAGTNADRKDPGGNDSDAASTGNSISGDAGVSPAPPNSLPAPQKAQASKGKATTDEDLRKQSQNPVANLISFPLQNNTNMGIEPADRNQNVLNIQPVIPVSLNDNWQVIIRWIIPVVWQPVPDVKELGFFGLGDMQPTFFLSPKKPAFGKLIWGVGPALQIPTATNAFLGQGKFCLGPSVVALVQPGPWTIGALVNNVWSVAPDNERPKVNQMLLQYFVNYNMRKGWYITSSPILTADWEATDGNRWVVPFGGGVGRLMRLGFQPVNISAQAFGNAKHPDGGSTWQLRFQIDLLFPTGRH